MKILFFNLNYGRNDFEGILEFIRDDYDILCFQEIKNDVKREIEKILFNYECGFISKELGEFGSFNLATYINKKFNNFSFEILEDNLDETTPAVYLEVVNGNSKWNILNFHGQPKPGTKLDNLERLEASNRIINFMDRKKGINIIGGDFNLLPDTQSILAFENYGYKNLIKEYKIKTTRNNNAWKHYDEKQLFADYIFVPKNLEIKNFEVIENEISDHLPLIIEI